MLSLTRLSGKRFLIFLAVLVFALLTTVACGPETVAEDPEEPEAPEEEPDDPEDDPDEDPDAPRQGGTMVMAGSFEPDHFNPCITTTGGVRFVSANVYPHITWTTTDMEVEPYLAHDWDICDEGLTYTFYLVENAVWEDGTPITAHDVVFSWGEVIPEHHIQAEAITGHWEDIWAKDDHTVVLEMKHPQPTFMLEADRLGIIPKHKFEGTDIPENPYSLETFSGGPFKLKEYVRGSHFELVAREDHWEEDRPYLDRIIFRFIDDPIARLTALEAGDIDYTSGYVSVSEAIRVGENPDFEMIMGGHWGHASISSTLIFNLRREPFDDQRVRQAIAYAIDLDYIKDTVTLCEGRIALSHMGSGNWASTDDVASYPFDRDRAEQILDDAGYPRGDDGMRFEMDLTIASNQGEHRQIKPILVDYLYEVGIDVVPRVVEPAAFDEYAFFEWDYDTCMRGIATGINPTGHATWRAYHSDNIRRERIVNNSGYSNPRVDELFDIARTQATQEEAVPYLHELQQILMDELPGYPMLERFEPYIWDAGLQGRIPDYYGNFSRVWWKDGG